MKIGIFYGTTSGFTQMVGESILSHLGDEATFTNIVNAKPEDILSFDKIIIGIPTWDEGQLQSDWASFFPQLDGMDFTGKTIAMYGLGDAYGYPETFQDALGTMGEKFESKGAKLIGFWPTDGYEFNKSKGVRNGKFLGLAIDPVNQDDQTPQRVEDWVKQIQAEFGAIAASA